MNTEFSINFEIEKPFSSVQEMFWSNHKLCSYREWIFDQLLKKDRLYHDFRHIASMWNIHRQMITKGATKSIISNAEAIVYAILYHDVVYNAKAPFRENEEKSEQVWRFHFHDQISPDTVEIVSGMIGATANHLDSDRYPLYIDWFLDLDLSGLAAPWEHFALNNELIRLENSHVSDFDFRRADFLKALLAKPKIYRHEAFEAFEMPARQNIQRLIQEYSGEGTPT